MGHAFEVYCVGSAVGICRRIMGDGFVGRLDLLDAAQVVQLQKTLGLPSEVPALRSAAAWRDFAKAGASTLQDVVQSDLAP